MLFFIHLPCLDRFRNSHPRWGHPIIPRHVDFWFICNCFIFILPPTTTTELNSAPAHLRFLPPYLVFYISIWVSYLGHIFNVSCVNKTDIFKWLWIQYSVSLFAAIFNKTYIILWCDFNTGIILCEMWLAIRYIIIIWDFIRVDCSFDLAVISRRCMT